MATEVTISGTETNDSSKREDDVSEGEEGEIIDADDPDFIPLCEENSDPLDSTSDEDEAPEEILNAIAKKKALEGGVPEVLLDPKLCGMCQKTPHKYRCPKCDLRTCSLSCSKEHKEVKNCDGVRPPFQPVAKISQFDAAKSIQDQQFLHAVQSNLSSSSSNVSPATSRNQVSHSDTPRPCFGDDGAHTESPHEARDGQDGQDGLRHKATCAQERFLIQNALRRRIWLSFTDDKGGEDCSRHEQFSDTIFWCIDLIFTKQLEDGTTSEYPYRVQNIPETIRLVTVLRQFLKPRQHGCIVSKSDLDMEKMAPFVEAGIESINGFMLVPNYLPERYYVINFEKDLLHNTRNRVIVNHPRIIITLNNEFMSSHQLISEAEAEEIRERQRQSRAMGHAADEECGSSFYRGGQRGGRGGFRGGRGGPRGGFRGGFRGGSFMQNDRGPRGYEGGRYNGKRSRGFDGDENGYRNKRGRGGRVDRGRPHSYRSFDDEFDPFEPFEGPVRLPRSYLGDGQDGKSENGKACGSSPKDRSSQETEATKNWEKCVAEKEAST